MNLGKILVIKTSFRQMLNSLYKQYSIPIDPNRDMDLMINIIRIGLRDDPKSLNKITIEEFEKFYSKEIHNSQFSGKMEEILDEGKDEEV